jgi:hypothetical protein
MWQPRDRPGNHGLDQAAPTVPTDASLLSRLRNQLARHSEAAAFWAVALLYLIPVWLFPYLPTQDGPAHLCNAQILKDYGDPAAGYDAFFELRAEPLPNLTSHALLAGLLYFVPALVAEKLLVSLYVLGFAASFRWFLGAFGPRCRPLAWAGLLLVFNRCFWMGFYNYCLSLILVWIVLGACLRWRGRLHVTQMFVLMLLFTVAYFTHLVGFLLAAAGAFGVAIFVSPRRILAPLLIVVAALPPACLTMNYFESTAFFASTSARRLFQQPLARLRGEKIEPGLWQELRAIDNELLANHVGTAIPASLVLAGFWGLLAILTIASYRARAPDERDGPGWLFPAVFGLLLLAGYLLAPHDVEFTHGGFLKTRLAPLPFLVWLACLREPAHRWTRLLVRAVAIVLLAVNLALVMRTVHAGNEELEAYTAGLDAAGSGNRLFVMQANPLQPPLANPLLHAADYYCLGNGNVNLDNYEASTSHFPVKYRPGVKRGMGSLAGYAQRDVVDLVLCWNVAAGPAGWDEVFRQGPLSLYRRPVRR